jgi:hypothetical protein
MMQQYWFFAEPLKHEATACLGPYYLASDVEALESAAVASALRVKELEKAMNPRFWTQEQHAAWHQNIPDVQAAFDALRSLMDT